MHVSNLVLLINESAGNEEDRDSALLSQDTRAYTVVSDITLVVLVLEQYTRLRDHCSCVINQSINEESVRDDRVE